MADPAAVGLYGGTFNPIHLGHLRAAEEVVEQLGLERMVFVPNADPPHKGGMPDEVIAPADARWAWTEAAMATNPRFEASRIEMDRPGASYLVDTLRALRDALAPARLVFTLGCDAFREMGTWREPETLLQLADFAVTTRPPQAEGSLADWLPAGLEAPFELAPDGRSARHREAGTRVRLLEIPGLEISASSIRRRIREGRSVRYLLPEAIHDAVVESRIYA